MSEPPRKRTRVDRACATCITSKVRCQDFNQAGCLRCRQKEVVCSLIELRNRTSPPSEYLTSTIAELTTRINSLEQVIAAKTNDISASPWSAPTPASNTISLRAAAGHAVHYRRNGKVVHDYIPDLLEKYTSTARQDRYPDVVGEGHITKEQLEIAFQLFKYRISSLLPLHPYTLTSTSAPHHLFQQVSILSYTPTLAPSTLPSILDRAVIHATCGAASREAVYALLLLSLAPIPHPSHRTSDTLTPTCYHSPLVLISMAYDMGRGLGMEEQCTASIRRKQDWGEVWSSDRAQDALMWEVVKSRYTMLHIQLCRFNASQIPPYQLSSFPTNLSESFMTTMKHLTLETGLVEIIIPLLNLLPELEAQAMDSIPERIHLISQTTIDVYNAYLAWRKAQSGLSKLLDMECTTVMLAMILRVISVTQYLPTPVHPSIQISGLLAGIRPLMTLLSQVIDLANNQDLSTLPSHILTMMGIAISAAQRTLVHRHRHNQTRDDGVPFMEDKVREAERRLKDVGFVFAMPGGEGWDELGKGQGVGESGMGWGDIWEGGNWEGFWQSFGMGMDGMGMDGLGMAGTGALDPGVEGLLDLSGGGM